MITDQTNTSLSMQKSHSPVDVALEIVKKVAEEDSNEGNRNYKSYDIFPEANLV
jgi:hypothetical protein